MTGKADDGCARCGKMYRLPEGYERKEHRLCNACEIKTLYELVAAQDKLLICYRLGSQRGGGVAAEKAAKARETLCMNR